MGRKRQFPCLVAWLGIPPMSGLQKSVEGGYAPFTDIKIKRNER